MSFLLFPERQAHSFGLTGTNIGATRGTAPGYDVHWMVNGILGYPWRSGSPWISHIITCALGSIKTATFAAVFDLRVHTPLVNVSKTQIQINGIAAETNGLPARRDYGFRFAPRANATMAVAVALAAGGDISIGEIVFANPTPIETTFRAWTRDDRRNTIRNGAFASRAGPRRMHLQMDWAALTDSGHASLMAAIDAADGALEPMILMPDDANPSEVYHGFLTDEHEHAQGIDGYHTGHSLIFTESRRAIG